MARERRVRGLISTTSGGTYNPACDYVTYLVQRKRRSTGVAFDLYGSTYVAGSTKSQNFPLPPLAISTPFQSTLIGTQNAFVSRSELSVVCLVQTATGSPQPSPRCGWSTGAFTFNITNTGPTPRPTSFLRYRGDAKQRSGFPSHGQSRHRLGSCNPEEGNVVQCFISTLQAVRWPSVEIDMTAESLPPPAHERLRRRQRQQWALYRAATDRNVVDFTWPPRIRPRRLPPGRGYDPGQLLSTPASLQYGGYSGTITPTQPRRLPL